MHDIRITHESSKACLKWRTFKNICKKAVIQHCDICLKQICCHSVKIYHTYHHSHNNYCVYICCRVLYINETKSPYLFSIPSVSLFRGIYQKIKFIDIYTLKKS